MPGKDREDESPGGEVVEPHREVRTARTGLRKDLELVDQRVDKLDERLDSQERRLGDIREGHARMAVEVQHLSRAHERNAALATTQAITDIEVRKAKDLSEIRERVAIARGRRALRRELIFKSVAIAMGLWAILSSLIASRC